MSVEIKIPMLGMSMTEGILTEWLALDGQIVSEGTPIYSLENDKSVHEIEAPSSGTLRIVGKVGETYPVGETIGKIE